MGLVFFCLTCASEEMIPHLTHLLPFKDHFVMVVLTVRMCTSAADRYLNDIYQTLAHRVVKFSVCC